MNYGVKASCHRTDVAEPSSVKEGFEFLIDQMSSVDILINCAGIIRQGSIIDATKKDLSDTIQVNLLGTYRCTKVAGPFMIAKRNGKVINFASTNADAGVENHAAYCASKGGFISFSKAMAIEWAKYGINVNAINPNVVKTSMTEDRLSKPGETEKSISRIPLGRLLVPEDLVGPTLFLASPASDLITDHILNVDGGYLAQ